MKKLLFVYNPRAGKEMLKPRLSDVLDIFVKAGYEVTVHPTQAYRDAYYQIKEYEVGKYDLIACSCGKVNTGGRRAEAPETRKR